MTRSADPYLLWAQATGFRYHGAPGEADYVAVAYQCDGNARLLQTAAQDGVLFPWRALLPSVAGLRYGTARVRRDRLDAFAARVHRLELGQPVQQHAADWSEPAVQRMLGPVAAPAAGARGHRPVIGVIDDEFAIGHAAFRAASGRSRFLQVWSQDGREPRDGQPWQPAAGVHGWILHGSAVTRPAARRHRAHGTHVASLAGGHFGPGQPADAAAEADLVGVCLPRRALADTSGGALAVHALEAVHFIQRAAGARPVVVNLSYGTWAGAHDGQSILEQALDELVDHGQGRLQVVVAAGNQSEARAHASGVLTSQPRVLRWQVLPDDGTPSFLELWVPRALAPGVVVRVSAPDGQVLEARHGQVRHAERDRQVAWSVLFPAAAAGSCRACGALVALSPTTARQGPVVAHGVWRVELWSVGGQGEFHAWIERDDRFAHHGSRGRPSFFLQEGYVKHGQRPGRQYDPPDALVRREGSFNTIATGRETIVVGGYEAASGRVASYSGSARGLQPRGQPDVLAPCEEGRGLHGLLGAAGSGVARARMNGTSVAAPQVTRAVANWMAANPALPAGKAPVHALPGVRPHQPGAQDAGADAPWRLQPQRRR